MKHSREDRPTIDGYEPEPPVAERLFGDRIDRARAYADDLALRGEQLGLIGPLELPRIWTRHVVNSALVAPLVRAGARVGDIGSGAGLPGLVLAIARPDAQFILVEPMERRTEWLSEQVRLLELDNVEVVRARAEDVRLSPWLDQVTARAVSALSTLVPMTARLAASGGELILMKGASVETELGKAQKAIRAARLSNVEIITLGDGVETEFTRVFRATVD